MNKKGFKDRAVMRKRMVLALWFITAVFGLLIVRLSYIMIVKRDDYSSRAEEQWTSEVRIEARRGENTKIEMEMNLQFQLMYIELIST